MPATRSINGSQPRWKALMLLFGLSVKLLGFQKQHYLFTSSTMMCTPLRTTVAVHPKEKIPSTCSNGYLVPVDTSIQMQNLTGSENISNEFSNLDMVTSMSTHYPVSEEREAKSSSLEKAWNTEIRGKAWPKLQLNWNQPSFVNCGQHPKLFIATIVSNKRDRPRIWKSHVGVSSFLSVYGSPISLRGLGWRIRLWEKRSFIRIC